MNSFWTTTLTVILVGLGVFAETNLLRTFLGDWIQGRREQHARQTRKKADMTRTAQASRQSRTRKHRNLTAAICAAGISASPTLAMPGEQSTVENSPTPVAADASTTLSFQPVQPPPTESKPVIISADRPGFSDSSGIVQRGHLQIETGYTYTFRDRAGVETQTHNGPELLARVGILEDRLELRLGTAGYVWSRSDSGSGFGSVEGFSDLSIGFKLKIIDQDNAIPRLCFEAMTTVGVGNHNISNRDLEPTLKLVGSWDLGDGFSLTTNAIVTYATSDGQRFVQGAGSMSLSYAVTDAFSIYGEYFVVGPHSKGTDAAHSVDFGGAYLLNNRVQLDARIGFGLNQEADKMFAGVGISFLF